MTFSLECYFLVLGAHRTLKVPTRGPKIALAAQFQILPLNSESVRSTSSAFQGSVVKKRLIIVECEITGDGATYYIDGKAVHKNSVVELAKSLNVQTSNLCQFLSQDTVRDFARMNPKQIFLSE